MSDETIEYIIPLIMYACPALIVLLATQDAVLAQVTGIAVLCLSYLPNDP